MKKILAFSGSPRTNGNSTILMRHFLKGTQKNSAKTEIINPYKIKINTCSGCLKCNLLKKCSLQNDEWSFLSEKILKADVLVFASPIYFHHVSSTLKKIIDRFRSFVQVQITQSGVKHTPWKQWEKDFVILLTMGSSDPIDAKPVIDLFEFITSILGPKNKLHILTGTRLALAKQVEKSSEILKIIYPKLELPENLAEEDYKKNQELLKKCYNLGEYLSRIN
ncbi:MAG: flavodoxin family protein [Bacteroidales bacterium]|nr:flavodoxin family protein [Bacteroidales bacterium]